eukprot:TRINITY_DN1217_c0_g3_i1.p1 TRINITY_DN1217_c0_g3~~TRINITY_DN1217_c0_g3_i1.p1  ORF type:complete len:827 (+),score=156.79 TRINITY_DN1217_c0_g3_i1:843-3323(+)
MKRTLGMTSITLFGFILFLVVSLSHGSVNKKNPSITTWRVCNPLSAASSEVDTCVQLIFNDGCNVDVSVGYQDQDAWYHTSASFLTLNSTTDNGKHVGVCSANSTSQERRDIHVRHRRGAADSNNGATQAFKEDVEEDDEDDSVDYYVDDDDDAADNNDDVYSSADTTFTDNQNTDQSVDNNGGDGTEGGDDDDNGGDDGGDASIPCRSCVSFDNLRYDTNSGNASGCVVLELTCSSAAPVSTQLGCFNLPVDYACGLACPSQCLGRGECSASGVCLCEARFGGLDCSLPATDCVRFAHDVALDPHTSLDTSANVTSGGGDDGGDGWRDLVAQQFGVGAWSGYYDLPSEHDVASEQLVISVPTNGHSITVYTRSYCHPHPNIFDELMVVEPGEDDEVFLLPTCLTPPVGGRWFVVVACNMEGDRRARGLDERGEGTRGSSGEGGVGEPMRVGRQVRREAHSKTKDTSCPFSTRIDEKQVHSVSMDRSHSVTLRANSARFSAITLPSSSIPFSIELVVPTWNFEYFESNTRRALPRTLEEEETTKDTSGETEEETKTMYTEQSWHTEEEEDDEDDEEKSEHFHADMFQPFITIQLAPARCLYANGTRGIVATSEPRLISRRPPAPRDDGMAWEWRLDGVMPAADVGERNGAGAGVWNAVIEWSYENENEDEVDNVMAHAFLTVTQNPPEICDPPCMNGGVCKGTDCVCTQFWEGDNCSVARCSPVCGHGTCLSNHTCMCDEAWTGPFCIDAIHGFGAKADESDSGVRWVLVIAGVALGSAVLAVVGFLVVSRMFPNRWKTSSSEKRDRSGFARMEDEDDEEMIAVPL